MLLNRRLLLLLNHRPVSDAPAADFVVNGIDWSEVTTPESDRDASTPVACLSSGCDEEVG